jgi:hypothetical protein
LSLDGFDGLILLAVAHAGEVPLSTKGLPGRLRDARAQIFSRSFV